MQYSVNQIYEKLYQKAYDVYEVFKNFFGEKYVDLQMLDIKSSVCHAIRLYLTTHGIDVDSSDFNIPYDVSDKVLGEIMDLFSNKRCVIYVWWPSVTVTNENDRSVVIQDLYAKILIQSNGLIPYEYCGFMLNRATYTEEQFKSDYMHSHIQCIPKGNFSQFMPPCLGRGPIAGTIQTLKTDFDEAEWMLFCQELSMYVTVESLLGVPWKHLESIGAFHLMLIYNYFDFSSIQIGSFLHVFPLDAIRDFIKYYLKHGHLILAYRDRKFVCGMSCPEYIIDVSNAFIDYYNKFRKTNESQVRGLYNAHLLKTVTIKDGKLYTASDNDGYSDVPLDRYRNKFVLRFKGKDILTTIIKNQDSSDSTPANVIDNRLAMFILRNILRTINYKYKNEHNNNNSNGGTQDSASTRQRTIYL